MTIHDRFSHGAPYIKAVDCRNTVLLTVCSSPAPVRPRIYKVNEDAYYVPSTQEFRFYDKKENGTRGDNMRSIKRAFSNLKALINCNYESPENIKYVTLTYAENMQDKKKLSHDMRYFFKKFKKVYGDFEYIYVVEKQARGAWHVHALFFFPNKAPFIPHESLRQIWGHGTIVNVQDLRNDLNNVGNYLCAYFTDDNETGKKGARLVNYESGVRLYRCSKGIKRPVKSQISFEQMQEFLSRDDISILSRKDVDVEIPERTLSYRYLLVSKNAMEPL